MAFPLARRIADATLLASSPLAAQQPPQNLQVLPKDIPRPELTAIMRGFTIARLRAVLTKNPNHQGAQNALRQLGAP